MVLVGSLELGQGRPPGIDGRVLVPGVVGEAGPALRAQARTVLRAQRLQRKIQQHPIMHDDLQIQ
jgi:hypothetical protein